MSLATPSASSSATIWSLTRAASTGAASAGSAKRRHTDVFERVAGSTARLATHGVRAIQSKSTAAFASARARKPASAADLFGPCERIEIVLDAQHRGRVDGDALEELRHEPVALGKSEQLGQRPGRSVALEPLDGARRQDQHAVRRLAAHDLLPGEGGDIDLRPVDGLRKDGGGGVGKRQAAAVGRDPIAVRHAHARGGAVPGEDDVAVEVDGAKVGQAPVVRFKHARVGELQLADDVDDPALAEVLPGQAHRRRARRAWSTVPSRRRRCRSQARWRRGNPRATREDRCVLSMARFNRASRLGRPVRASEECTSSAAGVHPGRLAQGPQEKLGLSGRSLGFLDMAFRPRCSGSRRAHRAGSRCSRPRRQSPRLS